MSKRNWKVSVASEEEASKLGYFSGAVTRDRLLRALTKRNPELRVIGISKRYYIPMFTIHNTTTNKVLCRSWKSILELVRRKGYDVREEDLL